MKIVQVGNFEPPHSTENELRAALTGLGHEVKTLQENSSASWAYLFAIDSYPLPDMVLWTRTGWDPPLDRQTQLDAMGRLRRFGVPIVGYHLDRWWGLNREGQVREEPFFQVDHLCTADGGHDQQWESIGAHHHWFPPAVSAFECVPGNYRQDLASDICFVGSWRSYGHHEWTHRIQLMEWLRTTYGPRVRYFPESGPAVRGSELRDLYASSRVVVGDSCLVPPTARYWSDRVPETVGRGGFLLHPWTEGIEEHFKDGEHLRLWQLGDWSQLRALIDFYLEHDEERQIIADHGKAHAMQHATYTVRMQQILDLVFG